MMTTYIFSYVHPMDKSIAFVIEPTRDFDNSIIENQFEMIRYGDFPKTKDGSLLDSIVKWVACYRAVTKEKLYFDTGSGSTCACCHVVDIGGKCRDCQIAKFGYECTGHGKSQENNPYRNANLTCDLLNDKSYSYDNETIISNISHIADEIGLLIAVYRHFYGKLPTPIYNAIPRDVYCRWKNYEART